MRQRIHGMSDLPATARRAETAASWRRRRPGTSGSLEPASPRLAAARRPRTRARRTAAPATLGTSVTRTVIGGAATAIQPCAAPSPSARSSPGRLKVHDAGAHCCSKANASARTRRARRGSELLRGQSSIIAAPQHASVAWCRRPRGRGPAGSAASADDARRRRRRSSREAAQRTPRLRDAEVAPSRARCRETTPHAALQPLPVTRRAECTMPSAAPSAHAVVSSPRRSARLRGVLVEERRSQKAPRPSRAQPVAALACAGRARPRVCPRRRKQRNGDRAARYARASAPSLLRRTPLRHPSASSTRRTRQSRRAKLGRLPQSVRAHHAGVAILLAKAPCAARCQLGRSMRCGWSTCRWRRARPLGRRRTRWSARRARRTSR